MKKVEVIRAVADRTGLSRADARAAVNAFACVVVEALKSGDRVQVTGFATFWPVDVSHQQVVNPRTRVLMDRPPYTRVKFRASRNVTRYLLKDNRGDRYSPGTLLED